jgi:hypothetical protein
LVLGPWSLVLIPHSSFLGRFAWVMLPATLTAPGELLE